MNECQKSYSLCEPWKMCSSKNIWSRSSLHRRCGLIKNASDSYQLLCFLALSDFEAHLSLGHNPQYVLLKVLLHQNTICPNLILEHGRVWKPFKLVRPWLYVFCLKGLVDNFIHMFTPSRLLHYVCHLRAPFLQSYGHSSGFQAWQKSRVESIAAI